MSAPPNLGQDVLEMNETYEDSDNGFYFAGTLMVYRMNGNLYHAKLKARYSSPSNVNTNDLENIIQIPISAYNPTFSAEFTLAPETLPTNSFVKTPD
ncbi:hypothetical protein N7522_002477 [Penicillium canescens]|uniref:Uncharacterized protein n=1 Tax=Penicillium canescens TaxID=5083 RepID=A0AAD6N515_PENCN|nr:hypothetical protein N7522_002477 [Penicillium canescens]KAJ6030491.1 hypothetical protein N7460_010757 [Penicillium canescens]KAJ6060866.1 hypothetical protein N7444_002720 [Penicillium canescens]